MDQVERAASARHRLGQSKAFLTGAVTAGFLVLVAALAPVLTAVSGQDYISYDIDQTDPMTGLPIGGISGEHWLGVEPMTGRDLFARLVYSMRFSLGVALGAAAVEVLLGLLVIVAARRGKVRGLLRPALMVGALLVPLNLLVEVWVGFQGIGPRIPPAPSWGGMLGDALTWYAAAPTYLIVPALLLLVTALAFLLLAIGLRRRSVTP